MTVPILEKQIEAPVVAWAKKKGILVSKMNGLGCRGWPDRCFWIPGGRPFFIEFKRPGGVCTPLQIHTHKLLREAGYDVEVFDDKLLAIRALEQALEAAQIPEGRDQVSLGACCRRAILGSRLGKDKYCSRCGKDITLARTT